MGMNAYGVNVCRRVFLHVHECVGEYLTMCTYELFMCTRVYFNVRELENVCLCVNMYVFLSVCMVWECVCARVYACA